MKKNLNSANDSPMATDVETGSCNSPEAEPPKPSAPSPSLAGRFDAVCDRFEAEWRACASARIEDYLTELNPAERPGLLRELLAVELELRHRRGEWPLAADYYGRFPDDRASVDAAFLAAGLVPRDGVLPCTGDSALETPAVAGAPAAASGPPQTHGEPRYRVLRPHARGGLGEVFLARDESLQRDVALKRILPVHAHSQESRVRFVLEAEVTGGLEHPGIVPVYGLGYYEDGRPYYAMRFIKGDSLKAAIAKYHSSESSVKPGERALALRELLGRFIAVCNAVAYAHSRGVLHRDLKPANVMLGPYGETLVVDWGLAKVLGEVDEHAPEVDQPSGDVFWPRSGSSVTLTARGSAHGTPAYMSPEQAAGRIDELGPASDVYSLGAMLYTVMTGRAPFEDANVATILRRVQAGDFRAPRAVKLDVPTALDAVCLKAMALQPADRYVGPRELAADLERWLGDEPTSVGREPLSARLGRWTRRHLPLVTGIAGVLLATLLALAVGTVMLRRANSRTEERRVEAEANYSLARDAIDRYLSRVSEEKLLNEPHMTRLRKDLLETAREFNEKLVERKAGDPQARADLGWAHHRLAKIAAATGSREQALQSALRGRDLFAGLVAREPRSFEFRDGLAACEQAAANHARELGRTVEARDAFARASALREALVVERKDHAPYLRDLATLLVERSFLATIQGDSPGAERLVDRSRELRERLMAQYPGEPEYWHALAASENNLGYLIAHATGRMREAEPHLLRARSLWTRASAARPKVVKYRELLASVHTDMGAYYRMLGRPDNARKVLEGALELHTKLSADYPEVEGYKASLSRDYTNLSNIEHDAGRSAECLALLDRAIKVHEGLVAAYPELPGYRSELCTILNNYANELKDRGRASEAEAVYLRVLPEREALVAKHPDVPSYRADLAVILTSLSLIFQESGRYEQAEAFERRALGYRQALYEQHPDRGKYGFDLADSLYNVGNIMSESGRYAEALAWFDKTEHQTSKLFSLEPDQVRGHRTATYRAWTRAQALTKLGRHTDAIAQWDRALESASPSERDQIRLFRASSRARAGDYRRSIEEAQSLATSQSIPVDVREYELACLYSISAGAVAHDASLTTLEASRESDRLTGLALAALCRAQGAGYFNMPRRRADAAVDADLQTLRTRPEAASLLLDLGMPPEPFAK